MPAAAGDEFRDLLTLVRQSGLLAKQPAYYLRKIIINLVLFVGAFLLIKWFQNPWLEICNAAFLAFVFAQLGFIVHDAGHQEIFSKPGATRPSACFIPISCSVSATVGGCTNTITIIVRRTTSPGILTSTYFPSHFPRARLPPSAASRASPSNTSISLFSRCRCSKPFS